MEKTPRILSTKTLAPHQKELLLNAGVSYVESDFIKTDPIRFEVDRSIENAIFTSQNSVKTIQGSEFRIQNCFCVGDKTEALLNKNGFNVLERAYTAKKLAEIIINNHAEKEFIFFCGDKRREELPNLLSQNNIRFKEVEVYNTSFSSKNILGDFDGILFFSPSAVQSFVLRNDFENAVAFCIGKTTEKEAKKHTNNIITANKPTIENVIVQVVKHFK